MKNSQLKSGFTIVELLIVIVVIAILAAITMLAYGSISNRSRDTGDKTDALTILKVTEGIYAETGTYPQGTSTATLKTAYFAGTTSKLPSNIDIAYATAAPANANAITSADSAANTFNVWSCATGANIYYGSRVAGSVQQLKAGTGC